MANKVHTGSRSETDGLLGRVLESLKQFVPPADVEARRAGLKSGTRVMESLLAAGFDEEAVLLACCSALSLPPMPDAWLTGPPVWPRELDVSVCLRLGVVPIGPSTEPLRLGFANVELAAKREIRELPPHKRYLMLGRNQQEFFNAGSDVSRDATLETEEKTSLTINHDFDPPTDAAVVPLPDEVARAARLLSSAADGEDDLLFTDVPAGGDESENDPTVQETTVPVPAARAPPPTEPTAPMRARLIGDVPLSTRKRSRTLVSPENQTTLRRALRHSTAMTSWMRSTTRPQRQLWRSSHPYVRP